MSDGFKMVPGSQRVWIDGQEITDVVVDVTPSVHDETVLVRAADLVDRPLVSIDDGTRAVARRDGNFVVVDFPDRGPFHRFTILANAMVRIYGRG